MRKISILITLVLISLSVFAQVEDSVEYPLMDYMRTREYVIADIQVTGVKYLNANHLITISGLEKGQKITIPGTELSEAIKKYWRYGLFSDVKILVSKIEGANAFIEIRLLEQPRLNDIQITGIKKAEQEDLKDLISLRSGLQVTDNIISNSIIIIKDHYTEKGFFNVDVAVSQESDTSGANRVNLIFDVKKNKKVKINEIVFEGNEHFSSNKLRKVFKKTKQRDLNIFKGSKYNDEDYKEDKTKLADYYNERGFRDFTILSEDLYPVSDKRVGMKISVYEGDPYYIRNISWVGNTKYPAEILSQVLGINEKEIYNKQVLNERINTDEDAISTLYYDNGYLYVSINPVELKVDNDSVDIEIRISEGEPAEIRNVIIKGNTKTNDHVVRRQVYTRPGDLFSKTNLMRSYREVASLGHFNPETIVPTPLPNPEDGTVDIEYVLEERPNDQLELSGGWGGYYGFVGSVGVRFTNMALDKIFEKDYWTPVPTGNGQTLSIRAQSNIRYQNFSISFMEPWLGGKKRNSLFVSTNYQIMRGGTGYATNFQQTGTFKTLGGSIGLGKQLKWPDDYFNISAELSYSLYKIDNYSTYIFLQDGKYHLFSLKGTLTRSSQDQPLYPRRGSNFSFSVQMTPPYSLFKPDKFWELSDYEKDAIRNDENIDDPELEIEKLENKEKLRLIEFQKWTFDAAWYTNIWKDLVLAVNAEFGALGYYNKSIGYPIFEKFTVGGSGMSGYSLTGTDVVPLRGYQDEALTPYYYRGSMKVDNGNIYTRYYAELRYLISPNPQAMIYGLAFVEGGNCWSSWDKFNPFDIKRSAGIGLRAYLPMFGLLGIDYGWGFDKIYDQYNHLIGGGKGEFSFVIGQQF